MLMQFGRPAVQPLARLGSYGALNEGNREGQSTKSGASSAATGAAEATRDVTLPRPTSATTNRRKMEARATRSLSPQSPVAPVSFPQRAMDVDALIGSFTARLEG